MFGRAWKIASIGGIAVRVDSSWAVIAVLITASLWRQYAEGFALSSGAALGLAVFTAVLFFGSVLVHELAHAGMARARGIEVTGITLFLFGGATAARMDDHGAGDEFLVTVVGPVSSAALGGIFLGLERSGVFPLQFEDVFAYLGRLNLLLAVFNLLPGFPLDGGRVLRAIVWKVTGSEDRATAVAAGVGMLVAAGMIGVGLYRAFTSESFSGLWLALIGWFLFQGARGATMQRRFRRVLAQGTVGEAMGPPPETIPAGISLSEALDRHLRADDAASFPVEDGGVLVGALTFESASRVGRDDPLRPVRDAMVPWDRILAYGMEDRLDRAAEGVAEGATALVVQDGRVVGSIDAEDVYRWLRARPQD